MVAQALAERYQKLMVGRSTLERELGTLERAALELRQKMIELDGEVAEISAAMRDYAVDLPPPRDAEDSRRHVFEGQRRFALREQARLVLAEGQESGQQKRIVIRTVKAILETMGSAHVRELYEMLTHHKVEVSSPQRLSQILSEAEEFEADRLRGWSLKSEKPGFRRPGFSVSNTPSSGDES